MQEVQPLYQDDNELEHNAGDLRQVAGLITLLYFILDCRTGHTQGCTADQYVNDGYTLVVMPYIELHAT